MLKLNAPIRAECADFIKREEGLRLRPYICPGGMKTIGYGHVLKSTDSVKEITEEVALVILREDLGAALDAIDDHVLVKLNQNQVIALCSFIFNVGINAFKNSALLKKLNADARLSDVAAEFHKWNKAGTVVLTGLVSRRKKEAELFLKPVLAPVTVPTITITAKKKHWFLELLARFLDLGKKA